MNSFNMQWLFGINDFKTLLLGFCSAIVVEVLGLLGEWNMWLNALVIFIVLDYISGLLAAYIEKKLTSKVGFKGIVKKMFIFILIAMAYQVDILLGSTVIKIAVIGFYIGIEGLSILENVGRAGLPVPSVLKESLERLQSKEDSSSNTN